MVKLTGAIWDLDGTIIDSASDIRRAMNELLRRLDRREMTLAEIKGTVGNGLRETFNRSMALTGGTLTDPDNLEAFTFFESTYNDQSPNPLDLYPGAVRALCILRDKGIANGLCTNKAGRSTTRILDGLGLTSMFKFIGSGDTFPVRKPHPGHILSVVKAVGLDPAGCVMIGDSVHDAEAARAANVKFIAVSHGYGNAGELGADAILPDFEALPRALHDIGFDLA